MREKIVKISKTVASAVSISIISYIYINLLPLLCILVSSRVFKNPLAIIDGGKFDMILNNAILNMSWYAIYIIISVAILFSRSIEDDNKFKYVKIFSLIYVIIYVIVFIIDMFIK